MRMPDSFLCIRGLKWSFPGSDAAFIDIPLLEAERGSVIALTGPSGCGKSTLLFLLSGLEKNLSGSLLWGDTDLCMTGEKAKERWRQEKLGMVFQDFQLIGELSVLENVLLPLSFTSWSPDKELKARAIGLLERLKLKDRINARAKELSRGEMQRCAIARALLSTPEVLLADEPTASLDAENEAEVAALLLELARENRSTLVVATHQRLLREKADIVVSLEHGALKEVIHV